MNRERFLNGWRRFLRWPGWTAWLKWKVWTAWLKWKGWRAIGGWRGWRVLLYPHPVVFPLLTLTSAGGLFWVFGCGQESHPLSCALYCLAFYTLVVLSLRIPGAVKHARNAIPQNPLAQKYLQDRDLLFRAKLYFDQFVNFLYGIFKTLYGFLFTSAWVGSDGLYNLALGFIQLVLILRRRREPDMTKQWKTYRFCGGLMLLLALPMAGMVYMAVQMGAHKEYPGFLIFVTALFAFYKLPSAFIKVAKDRRHSVPVDSAVRLLKLSQALFSMFSLQASMIHQFGSGQAGFARLMNTLTGSAVCLLVAGMGIYMLHRGNRDLKHFLQENEQQ